MTTETILITDPAQQSSGWYIAEEEAEHAAQQRLQKQWAGHTIQVAIAQLNMATALLDSQEYDARSCLIQAGIVEQSLDELEYLYEVGRRVIPAPGYVAWCALRGVVVNRVGRRVLGVPGKSTTDPDAWYLHILGSDLRAAVDSLQAELDDILAPAIVPVEAPFDPTAYIHGARPDVTNARQGIEC